MTTTLVRERSTAGTAHTCASVVTVGQYADGRPARLTVGADGRSGGHAEHVTVYGDTRSGVTTLLHKILTDGLYADWQTVHVDPNADSVSACNQVLRDEYDIARLRVDTPADERPMRLLVIDDLHELIKHRRIVHNLHQVATIAGRAGTAVMIGTHDISLSGFGGRYRDSTLTRAALTQNLLTLRASDKPLQRAALRALGVDMDRFDGRLTHLTAGVGFLPRVSGQPIRIRQP